MSMGFAQGLTFSIGFVLVLLAHLLSIMTHITLGNELIVSKVSYSSVAFVVISMWIKRSQPGWKIYKNGKSRGSMGAMLTRQCSLIATNWKGTDFLSFFNCYFDFCTVNPGPMSRGQPHYGNVNHCISDSCFNLIVTWSLVT